MGGQNDDYTKFIDSNNETVLSAISQCIATNGSPTSGNSFSVGIYDGAAKSQLQNLIIDAIRKRKPTNFEGSLDKNISENIKNNKELTKRFDQLVNRYQISIDKLGESLKKQWNNDKSFKDIVAEWIGKEYPKLYIVFQALLKTVRMYFDNGARQVEVFQKLVNSGIALEGTTTSLYSRATKAGIAFDDFVNLLSSNSNTYAKLNGLMKDSGKSFDKMVRTSKDVTNELGLNFKSSVEISSDYLKNNAYLGLMQGKSMDTLIRESEIYAKQLLGLSKATGQSTEAINNEIKAREKDNFWRIMSMDPRNKEKIAHMTALGFSQDMMEGILTGVPNAALAQASAAKGFTQLISYFSAGGEFDKLKTNEERLQREKQIGEEISPYNEKFLESMQKNPALLRAYKDIGFVQASFITKNAAELDLDKTNKKDQRGFKYYSKFEEQLAGFKNIIEESVTPQLKDFGAHLNKLNGILEKMNNGGSIISNFLSKFSLTTNVLTTFLTLFLGNKIFSWGINLLSGFGGSFKKILSKSFIKMLPRSWIKGLLKLSKDTKDAGIFAKIMTKGGAVTRTMMKSGSASTKGELAAKAMTFGAKGGLTSVKTMSAGARNAIKKSALTTGLKTVAKEAPKLGMSAFMKKIPVLGLGIGTGLAINRLLRGDLVGAGLELSSGAASTFAPGAGTATSVGLDAYLMYRDLKKEQAKNTNQMDNMKSSNENKDEKSEECPCAPYFEEINTNLKKVLSLMDNIKSSIDTTANCCSVGANYLRDISQSS